MKKQNKKINGKSEKASDQASGKGFDDNGTLNIEDAALFGWISDYMKGRLDLEEVRNDPGLPEMDKMVKLMITDYNKNKSKSKNNENFIRDTFSENITDDKMLDEISHIKLEISKSNVNDISADWVMEWHEKRQKQGVSDHKTIEIKNFITDSLDSEEDDIVENKPVKKQSISRTLLIRYTSIAAAAIIGAFVLVNSLTPSYDSDKLFNSYYEPWNVVSPVTRGINPEPGNYISAIESFKLSDYQAASAGFAAAIIDDPSAIAPRFLLGVTEISLGNYNKAIDLLSSIETIPGEFGKETQWYLGLAYLKTGDNENAAECFELLAMSPGYYSERAEKILRRLK
jgi:hypothetical protein